MASYLDKIPQFNPYVAQMPVEAMVQVGMEKQKRYDEGVQRIQSQIDSIAGMDIVRDVDKQYLQSKLNELQGNLRTVAAGDFSNFQLVNSVGAMTGRIAKDPNVLSALVSTKTYRKGLEDMATYTKEGKGSPSNDWDFRTQASSWLNSKDLKATFNGSYNPYTNYKKNALEIIKAVTKDESITDAAFEFDKNGNITGITDAITKQKFAGASPEKIREALMAGLTPADFRQMEIDGRYQYSSMDATAFEGAINNSYKSKIQGFTEQKNILENAKMSTTSNVEKATLDKQIASIDKMLKNINSEYSGITGMIESGNVEGAKARLHTADFLNGFSKAFSYTQTSQTYESSPFVAARQWREGQAQQWKEFAMKFEQDERQFDAKQLLEGERLNILREKNRLKKIEMGDYGGLPTTVKQDDLPIVTLAKVKDETENTIRQLAESDINFMKQNGKDQAWLDQQRLAWQQRPSSVDPLVKQHFERSDAIRRKVNSDMVMISQISAEATAKYGDIYSKIPANAPSLTVTDPLGNKTNYSPRDFVDFNSAFERYRKISSSGSGMYPRTEEAYNDELAKKELSSKQYRLYEAYKKVLRGQNLSQDEESLMQLTRYYGQTVNLPFLQTIQKINDYTGTKVKERIRSDQGVSYGLPVANAAQKTQLGNVLISVADLAKSQSGGIAHSPDLDISTLEKIAVDESKHGTITVVEGTEYQPAMYEITVYGKGGISTKFRMTPEQKRSVFGSMYEADPRIATVQPYLDQIRKMGGYTTGYSQGPTTPQNSYLSNIDFPKVSVYGVTGNIVTPDGGQTFSIRLNLHDPVTKQTYPDLAYPKSGMMTASQLAEAMMKLNDAAIYQIINESKTSPTTDDIDNVKEASKKPL